MQTVYLIITCSEKDFPTHFNVEGFEGVPVEQGVT